MIRHDYSTGPAQRLTRESASYNRGLRHGFYAATAAFAFFVAFWLVGGA